MLVPLVTKRQWGWWRICHDIWVSLPVGSEESYTFRHMLRNQYKETLFDCEDERFEIDMVIDSAAMLRHLEPISEEIALLQENEVPLSSTMFMDGVESYIGKKDKEKSVSNSKGGLSGKVFQYYFYNQILNTLHKHCITHIYGNSGQEMLKMLSKNPVVAVPVVIKRLRQKDEEFQAAREVLNRRWKELAKINYYKSLNHRSLTWRATDKQATITHILAVKIKDQAAHKGNEKWPLWSGEKRQRKSMVVFTK